MGKMFYMYMFNQYSSNIIYFMVMVYFKIILIDVYLYIVFYVGFGSLQKNLSDQIEKENFY